MIPTGVAAVSAVLDILQVVTSMMDQAHKISAVIRSAQEAGRDITAEEWAAIDGDQIAAKARAVAAVAALPQ
jgi:Na+-transporting methylmalonyl-CoA/oxaloacetate decarboxylase gamma subunit